MVEGRPGPVEIAPAEIEAPRVQAPAPPGGVVPAVEGEFELPRRQALALVEPEVPFVSAETGEAITVPERMGGDIEIAQNVFTKQYGARPDDIQETRALNKQQIQALEVADAMGSRVTFYTPKAGSQPDGAQGFFMDANERIYINSNIPDPNIAILGHESFHELKVTDRAAFDSLKALVKEEATNLAAYMLNINNARKAQLDAQPLTENDILEEFAADLIGDQFTKKEFWQKVETHDASLGRKLAKIINDLIESIKKKLSGTHPAVKNAEKVQDAIAAVYADIVKKEVKRKAKRAQAPTIAERVEPTAEAVARQKEVARGKVTAKVKEPRVISEAEVKEPLKIIDRRINEKYADILDIDEDFSGVIYDKVEDRKLTPKALDKHLTTISDKRRAQIILNFKSIIADQTGELIELYKYESYAEGKELEDYLDSLLEVIKRHEPGAVAAEVKPAKVKKGEVITEAEFLEPHKLIENRINKKYADILAIEQEGFIDQTLERIEDRELTPEALNRYFEFTSDRNKDEAILNAKAVIADQIGELISTHKYESFAEGKALEDYLDSLLKVIERYRVSRKAELAARRGIEEIQLPLFKVKTSEELTAKIELSIKKSRLDKTVWNRKLREHGPDMFTLYEAADPEILFKIKEQVADKRIKLPKWYADFDDSQMGKVNNRISRELDVFEQIFGPVATAKMVPGKLEGKKRPPVRGILPYDFLLEFYRVIDNGDLAQVMDRSKTIKKLAIERGIKGAKAMPGMYKGTKKEAAVQRKRVTQGKLSPEAWGFLDKVYMLRQGSLYLEVDEQGKPILSENGKAGMSTDLSLATCHPTTPCKECYAAGMTRQNVINKAIRNTLHILC